MIMIRLASIALVLLAGCTMSMTEKVTPDGLAGMGTIESIVPAPEVAAAGGTAGSGTKRVAVRMADGAVQVFHTRAVNLKLGEQVEIEPDGYIRHPAR